MSKGNESPKEYGRVLRAAALIGGVGALTLNACSSHGDNASETFSSPRARTTASAPVKPGMNVAPTPFPSITVNSDWVLDQQNFCTWKFGAHPVPLANRNPVEVRIDDRCRSPADADPKKDHPTGIYSTPYHIKKDAVIAVPDGGNVMITCFTNGEMTPDANGDVSSLWLGVEYQGERGYMPDVGIGGGYTVGQLESLGLTACRSS